MARSHLFEHAQETLRLLAEQARAGYAEGVRKRTLRDDQTVVEVAYQAALLMVPDVEAGGHAFALLRKSLTRRQYRLLAELARPCGWQVSRYRDPRLTDVVSRNKALHYLHTGSVPELTRALRRLSKGTLVFEATL